MGNVLLTRVPVGTIDGHVQWTMTPTSLVKKVHDEFILKGQAMRHPKSKELLVLFHHITIVCEEKKSR